MRWALVAGLLFIFLATSRPPLALADELLVNGGFEAGLDPWKLVAGGSGCPPRSGSGAVTLTRPVAGMTSILTQEVGPLAQGSYTLSGFLRLHDGSASLLVQVRWTDLSDAEIRVDEDTFLSPASYAPFELTLNAPSGAVHAALVMRVSASEPAAICLDDLSLQGPPFATPIPTSTPMATATSTSTSTPVSTATASPTSTPTRTASPTPAAPTLTFINGGFEQGTAGWQKFGGELSAVSAPLRSGALAGALASATDSTKWAYQAVAIEPSLAYEFAGHVRPEGAVSAVYLRISWYESVDGSGAALSSDDSTATLSGPSDSFVYLTTGPRLPPPRARSMRARVLLTPLGAAQATLYMDDFSLTAAAPPSLTPTPTFIPSAPVAIVATATPVVGSETPVRQTPSPAASATRTPSPAMSNLPSPAVTPTSTTVVAELVTSRRPSASPSAAPEPLVAGRADEDRGLPLLELAAGVLLLLALAGSAYEQLRSRRNGGP